VLLGALAGAGAGEPGFHVAVIGALRVGDREHEAQPPVEEAELQDVVAEESPQAAASQVEKVGRNGKQGRIMAPMSDDKRPVFTAERLREAITELGQLAYDAGRVIDVAIYDGSCLMLVSNFRIATADVDAVAAEDQGFLDNLAQKVAARHGWPRDWLNDGVRTYLSPQVEGFAQHTLFRTYPREETPGLRVFVPGAEYILAMKLMALRLDPGGERNDLEDILNLMRVAGLKEKADILQFAGRFYPEARTSGRLALAVDHLWNEYSRRTQRPDNEPPRYLGRSGPAN